MEVFTFIPNNMETLDSFNKRLRDYCENPAVHVVAIHATCFGPGVVITATKADDIPGALPLVLTAELVIFAPHCAEETLDKAVSRIRDRATPEVMSSPVEVLAFPTNPPLALVKTVRGVLAYPEEQ